MAVVDEEIHMDGSGSHDVDEAISESGDAPAGLSLLPDRRLLWSLSTGEPAQPA